MLGVDDSIVMIHGALPKDISLPSTSSTLFTLVTAERLSSTRTGSTFAASTGRASIGRASIGRASMAGAASGRLWFELFAQPVRSATRAHMRNQRNIVAFPSLPYAGALAFETPNREFNKQFIFTKFTVGIF